MVAFMDEKHTSKKTNKIIDKKAEQIIESVKENDRYMLSQETQDGSVQSNSLSQAEINTLFLQEVKVVKGFRFGSLPELRNSSSSFSDSSTIAMQEKL